METLVFGDAVARALAPERLIVGCAEPEAPLPHAYATYLAAFDRPILKMRYESAELAKISINLCLAAQISVANAMAELCERIGADWAEIAPALRLDRRIGPDAYLAPGLGIAGGNLERDLAAVQRLCEREGLDASLIDAQCALSKRRRDWAATTARRLNLADDGRPLALWGLTYKPNTDSVKNAPALHTIDALSETRFQAHDPAAPPETGGPRVRRLRDPLEALEGAAALMILTPWAAYRTIAPEAIAERMDGAAVLDPYQALDPAACAAAGLERHTLGARPPC